MYLKHNRSYVEDQLVCLVLLIAGGIYQDRVGGVLGGLRQAAEAKGANAVQRLLP